MSHSDDILQLAFLLQVNKENCRFMNNHVLKPILDKR